MDNATTQAETFDTLLKTTKYYLFGSQRVAMRVLADNGRAVYYLHGDHPSTRLRTGLGSVSMSTNALGESESQARFTLFGEALTWAGRDTA